MVRTFVTGSERYIALLGGQYIGYLLVFSHIGSPYLFSFVIYPAAKRSELRISSQSWWTMPDRQDTHQDNYEYTFLVVS